MMLQIVVRKVLPVFTIIVTPVLAIILHVSAILLPVFSSACQAIVQAAPAVFESLRTICRAIPKPSTLIRQS